MREPEKPEEDLRKDHVGSASDLSQKVNPSGQEAAASSRCGFGGRLRSDERSSHLKLVGSIRPQTAPAAAWLVCNVLNLPKARQERTAGRVFPFACRATKNL